MKNGKYELVIPPNDYPGKRYRGRYAYEHHVVFWQTHGRLPKAGCVVHHRNDQKRENIPSNLEEKSRVQHTADHARTGRAMRDLVCGWCGVGFQREARNCPSSQLVFCCCRSHQVRLQQRNLREKRRVIGG